jgi:DnaJ-class molecular chaperone
MKRDDLEFMERISHDLEARRMACKVLGVEEMADKEKLKKAYRRTAMEFHPDKKMIPMQTKNLHLSNVHTSC